MKKIATLAGSLLAFPAQADAQQLASPLAGISFLVGKWCSGKGNVADTGGTSTGRSMISIEAGGAVLLRRDHTDLFDSTGKPSGGFDQIMMIYPEDGTLHADYSDGSHLIHYNRTEIEAGRSVIFTSVAQAGRPVFRLGYQLSAPGRLTVAFAMQPPGASGFQPIADGVLMNSSGGCADNGDAG